MIQAISPHLYFASARNVESANTVKFGAVSFTEFDAARGTNQEFKQQTETPGNFQKFRLASEPFERWDFGVGPDFIKEFAADIAGFNPHAKKWDAYRAGLIVVGIPGVTRTIIIVQDDKVLGVDKA